MLLEEKKSTDLKVHISHTTFDQMLYNVVSIALLHNFYVCCNFKPNVSCICTLLFLSLFSF